MQSKYDYFLEKTAKGYLPFRKTWYGKRYIGETKDTREFVIGSSHICKPCAAYRVPCATYQKALETCARDARSFVSVSVDAEQLKRWLDAAHVSCDAHVGASIRDRDTIRKLQGRVSARATVINLLEHHVKLLQEKRDEQAKTIGDLRNEVEVLKAVDTLCKCEPKPRKGKHDKA